MTDYGTPENPDLIQEAIKSALLNMFVACPGIVQKYYDAKRTVDVAPATRRIVPLADGTFTTEDVPVIQNVPILAYGSPNTTIEILLARGDTVLLVFCDYSFAAWRSTGGVSDPLDTRKHGPSYPVAIPWFRPKGKASANAPSSMGAAGTNAVRVHFDDPAYIRIGTDYPAAPDFVAMAAKTNARLDALENWANTTTFPTGVGPSGTTLTPLTPGESVASENLKAE